MFFHCSSQNLRNEKISNKLLQGKLFAKIIIYYVQDFFFKLSYIHTNIQELQTRPRGKIRIFPFSEIQKFLYKKHSDNMHFQEYQFRPPSKKRLLFLKISCQLQPQTLIFQEKLEEHSQKESFLTDKPLYSGLLLSIFDDKILYLL